MKKTAKKTAKKKAKKRPEKAARKSATRRTVPAPRTRPKLKAVRAADRARARENASSVGSYIVTLPAWQRKIATRFDEIVGQELPDVQRVIKWGLPFYGVPDRGWFVSCGGFATCVKITFFQGASLKPLPPTGKGRQPRGIDIRRGEELDDKLIASWVRQAAALPGFGS